MSSFQLNLREIVEKSYEVFAKYELGKTLDVCSHCVSEQEINILLTKPLREFSAKDIYSYYSSAQDYGEQEFYEMKHYLPRVLELLIQFEMPFHSLELSLNRFNLQKNHFEGDELENLWQFSHEYFGFCLEHYPIPNDEDIDAIIIMFGLAGFELSSILQKWLEKGDRNGLLHLNDFFTNQVDYIPYKPFRLKNAFSTKEINAEIHNWFEKEETKSTFAKNIEIAIGNNILDSDKEFELSNLYEAMIL